MMRENTMKNKTKKIAPIIVLFTCVALVFAAASFNGCGTTNYEGKVASVSVAPGSVKIGPSKTQQFTATGVNSDPNLASVTNYAVTWASSDTSIATIEASSGLATAGTTTGTATITATDASGVVGRATLEVGEVKSTAPVSIAITPASPSISVGKPAQFYAIGTYDDGTTQDVTASVTWTSSNTAVVDIDAASGYASVPTGATVGATATITATLTEGGTTITGTTVLTVAPKGGKY
jgi:hypothetical protein